MIVVDHVIQLVVEYALEVVQGHVKTFVQMIVPLVAERVVVDRVNIHVAVHVQAVIIFKSCNKYGTL